MKSASKSAGSSRYERVAWKSNVPSKAPHFCAGYFSGLLKPFVLSPEMLTVFGVFYPTGYIVMMFPHVEQAEQAAHELLSGGYERDALTLLSPETILREIARVDGESDIALPSVGTEGATAQTFIKLAREGQFGLMVHAKSDKDTEAIMVVARRLQFSYAQKYHMLAMEDLK